MARRPDIVEKAETIIEQFLLEWQKRPRFWYTEVDVQAELSTRLRNFFGLQGLNSVFANYPEESGDLTGLQEWARITCEPTLYYKYENYEDCECRPDLVIWDDADQTSPPDAVKGNWPVIWACEIKYRNYKPGSWDQDKLRHLINQKTVSHGCWLVMSAIPADSGTGIGWEQDKKCNKIWVCNAYLLPLSK